MPGVLSVIPDPDFNSMVKDYSYPNGQLSSLSTSYTEGSSLFPAGTSKHWLVRMARPSVGVIRKGPMVGYYVQVLTEVLGNEDPRKSIASSEETVRTKKLFVTGLSFYTSEKTLLKIIMDKISKRLKGYAFVEYTTVEAANAALKEMNGEIINGWTITVDVAKTNPPKYSRGRPGAAR
ncbi:unnamed protein product [Withania somnifera]